MPTPKLTYSRQTLEETPQRVLHFLAGVGTNANLRTLLANRGYTEAEHQHGWRLLHAATGYAGSEPAPAPDDRTAAQALAEIDAWDEPNFRLARAALNHRFPEQAEFVFADLTAATGDAALLSVHTFLDRLDMLEGKRDGRDHKNKATQKKDAEALAMLETRGISSAERARLRKLLGVAQSGVKPTVGGGASETQAAQREETLLSLRLWYDEWSEVARIFVTRRDYLIRLGLAQRKKAKKSDAADPEK